MLSSSPLGYYSHSQGSNFALYVHIPFCLSKCPYCDFNSYCIGLYPPSFVADYVQAIGQEAAYFAQQEYWQDRKLSSVFFGGGTPSLLEGAQLISILHTLNKSFSCSTNLEVTLEANPGSLREALSDRKLSDLAKAGFNRISIGAQSFSANKLAFLERIHSPTDTASAVISARNAGFANINLDLMFATAGETVESWKQDLRTALSLKPSHLSVYNLTIESNTMFGRRTRQGDSLSAHEQEAALMFELAQDLLTNCGYNHYEVSNYALPGLECRHNLSYWNFTPYLGLGAGAHSFQPGSPNSSAQDISRETNVFSKHYGLRWQNFRSPQAYLQDINASGRAIHSSEYLSPDEHLTEYLMLRLRTAQGLPIADFCALFGVNLLEKAKNQLEDLLADGLIHFPSGYLAPTPRGLLLADHITLRLLEAL